MATEMREAILIPSAPVYSYLELTPECNNRCPGCSNVFVTDKKTGLPPRGFAPLDSAGWRVVISKLKPYVHRLRITGGEPTLHPDFEDILLYTDEIAVPFAIFSNGRWPNPQRLIPFLKDVSQFRSCLVSLHGASVDIHEAFTKVCGSFDETVANIKLAVRAGLPVSTNTVITEYNYDQVEEIVGLSLGLGANYAVFNRYLGDTVGAIGLTPWQLKEAMTTIDALTSKGVRIRLGNCIPQCFYPSSSIGCLAGVAYCTVDPWGNVRPCNHTPLVCGNLLEQSVEEVWNSEAMEHWRGLIPAQCESCLEFPKCHGGCRAAAIQLGFEKDPLMVKPVLEKPDEPLEELVLYEGAHPIGKFDIRSEEFGYILIYGNRLVPVTHQAKVILDSLDGRTTLRQIEETYGRPGISLVGLLYKQGLVGLE